MDADFRQAIGHFAGAFFAPTTGLLEALHQFGVVMIEPQANNVDRFACKGYRDFGARQIRQTEGFCSGQGAVLATDFVMVSE
jgi:hypothetical protein